MSYVVMGEDGRWLDVLTEDEMREAWAQVSREFPPAKRALWPAVAKEQGVSYASVRRALNWFEEMDEVWGE